MKKIITLTLIIAAFSSCSNMDSDASGETDEAKNEVKLKLDSMNNEMVVMGKQMEETLSKYDEEILKYLLENCEQKKVSSTTDEITVAGVTMPKSVFQDLKDIIDDPSLVGALDASSMKLIGKVIAQNEEIVNITYKEIIQNFLTKTNGGTERDYLEVLGNEMEKSGKNLRETLSDISDDELTNEILIKKLRNKLRDIDEGTFTNEVSPKPINNDSVFNVLK